MFNKLDVLDFMQLNTRTTMNVGAWDLRTPIDPKTGVGQIKRLKAVSAMDDSKLGLIKGQADTWDLNLYNDDGVRSWITELAYHTPRDYKKFVGNYRKSILSKYEDGIFMFERWIDPVSNNLVHVTDKAQTKYNMYKDCKLVKTGDLGQVTHRLQGPFMIDHQGNVGKVPTLIHTYDWMDNGVPAREENWYAWYKGWLRWCLQHQNSNSGLYLCDPVNNHKDDKVVVHNMVVPGGAPMVNFPCF